MSDDPSAHAWPELRRAIRGAVPESTWHLWLEPLTFGRTDAGVLVITAPAGGREFVAERFGPLLEACAARVLGPGVAVHLVEAGTEPAAPDGRPAGPASGPAARAGAVDPRLTFEQFVIGDANRLAHAAALAVAERPGDAYNPLYVCGPPGLGKTHLLHSIANYVRDHGDGLDVRYTTAEAFTDAYVGAVHTGAMEAFRVTHRDVDLLLVDDVQFLQRKEKTGQEFFHTFNALLGGGAQVVLTSDRLPRDLGELEDRLRERFEAGLVCDVGAPDHGTRMTILRKRVLQDPIAAVDPDALELIASRVTQNVRALEGALIRVVAYASLTGAAVSAELAARVLDGLYPETRPRACTVREIQERTSRAFGVSVEQLVSTSRAEAVTWPRQVAMYLARELTDQSLPAIGSAFGGRSHTTVLHACRRTAARVAADRDAFDAVSRLTAVLRDSG